MKFPKRRSLNIKTIFSLLGYLFNSYVSGNDPGYHGKPYKIYTKKLENYYGVNHAIPVCSGTNAIYLALKSLQLKGNQFVYVSPISDPGTFSAICENNYGTKILDTKNLSGNASPKSLDIMAQKNGGAILLVHHAGWHADIKEFRKLSVKYNLSLIQDFSQSHGYNASFSKNMLENEIAVFSTMYRKSQSSGGAGGFIITNSNFLGNSIRSLSDRGKFIGNNGKWLSTSRNGNKINFPSLNHCLDDVSCVLEIEYLKILDITKKKRLEFNYALYRSLKNLSDCVHTPKPLPSTSPFIIPISLINNENKFSKEKLSEYLFSFDIPHNPNYQFLSTEWEWFKPYVKEAYTKNAKDYLERTIFLYVNERYKNYHANFIYEKLRNFFLG